MSQPRSDRRVRKTRAAIHLALLTLMRERGYDAVTVTDIIDRADVGRSTFYAHFTDKRHVLDDSLADLSGFLRARGRASVEPIFGFSLAMFEHAREQRELATALLGRRGGAFVQERIATMLGELARDDLRSLAQHPDGPAGTSAGNLIGTTPIDLVATGVVGAFMALLANWIDTDDPRTPAEMNDCFRRLVVPGVLAMMDGG